jgi:hypothetical protein
VTSLAFLPVIAATLFIVGILALGFLLWQILRSARMTDRERKYQTGIWRSDVRRAAAVVGGLLVIGVANLVFWLSSELRAFSPVAPGLPIGMVGVINESDGVPRLVFSSIDRHGREIYEIVPVRDAAFRIAGERIHWAPILASLGLDDFAKVTEVSFHPEPRDGVLTSATYHTNIRSGPTRLYRQLGRFRKWLPFVEVQRLQSPPYNSNEEFSAQLFVDTTGITLQ